jgi:GTPase SAR1 family protein
MAEEYKYSAEATFRGFRAQTLYILNRIITDNEKFDYRLEGHEDLDIWSDKDVIELIQVKCYYSHDLVLSDFEPEKESSFFRRSVDRFNDGLSPKTNVISFGNIGPELKNGFRSTGTERDNIISKLKSKGYKESEIALIFQNIKIIKVNEAELEEEIFNYLKENHCGFDPDITFDLLMNWIYQLSERSELVNKVDLVQRLNNIASFLSELSTFLEEFGLSVKQLEAPEDFSLEKLEEEFYAGSHARYEHIIADLDAKRSDKLDEIKQKFELNNVIIIHGASGQGKSTLAYRFLHENYPNSLTYQIKSKERDALKIIRTLNAISKSIDDHIAIFIDVEPTDNVWQEIVKEISRYQKFDILVTIREEDWNRSSLSSVDLFYSEMELYLNKEEAEEIYENLTLKNENVDFINFEESWSKFGGSGPLLEFVYLITQGETLRNRLEQQIERIREEAHQLGEIERLDFLRIVSIIGMYGCRSDLKSLKSEIKLKDPTHVVKIFQEEYLLREESSGKYIGALHPIRSKILSEILTDPVLEPIEENIDICLSVINEEDMKTFLVNIFIELGVNNEILNDIYSHVPVSWIDYGLVIESLLWLGAKNYLELNEDVVNEAHEKFGFNWSLFLIPDLSNAMQGKMHDIIGTELVSDEYKEDVKNLRNKLSDRTSIYTFLKKWLTESPIPLKKPQTEIEFLNLGLSLFWFNRLDIKKEIDFSEYSFESFNSLPLNGIADFMLGLQYFDPESDIIEEYLPKIVERVKRELLIPSIDDDGERIMLHCIIDITEVNKMSASKDPFNDFIMDRLNLIRKLYPQRKKFASKGYGNELFLFKMDFDGTKKDIPIYNIPLDWLTQINSNFHQLAEHKFRPDRWEEYINYVVQCRVNCLGLVKRIIDNLQIFFRRSGKLNILQLNSLNDYWDDSKLKLEKVPFPKSSVDFLQLKKHKLDEKESTISKFDIYSKVYGDFVFNFRNFLNQGLHVMVLQTRSKGKSNDEIEIIKNQLKEAGFRTDFNDLSIMNLYDSYKNLLTFQGVFKDLFGKFVFDYDLDDLEEHEKLFYGLLAELWRIFAKEGYEKNKKIIKRAKNEFKKERDSLSNDITTLLEKEGINVELNSIYIDYNKENYLICNVSNSSQIEETLLKIINILNNNFNGVLWTDLKKLFLDIEFEFFRVIILVQNRLLLPVSNNIPLFKVLGNIGEIDIMVLNPKPLNEKIEALNINKWQDEIPRILELDKAFKIEELQQLMYHLKQLADLDLDDLGFEITQDYAYKVSKTMSERYQEVLDSLKMSIELFSEDIKSLEEINEDHPIDNSVVETKKADLEFLVGIKDKLLPEKYDNSGKIDISIKLEDIDNWFNRVQDSKKDIYVTYLYFTNQLISEYVSNS